MTVISLTKAESKRIACVFCSMPASVYIVRKTASNVAVCNRCHK